MLVIPAEAKTAVELTGGKVDGPIDFVNPCE
jgi:hypothetical protein